MAHSATKVLMGSTQSSFKTVDNHAGDVAAGLIVTLKSDDTITTTLADGVQIGVSLGKSLSDTSRTAICRRGTRVPVLVGSLTPTIGAQVQVHATTGKAVDSGTAVNAVLASGLIDALLEDGTTVTNGAVLIDMPGGL